jgi:hypothetical protein
MQTQQKSAGKDEKEEKEEKEATKRLDSLRWS